jgi:hypothetical protein
MDAPAESAKTPVGKEPAGAAAAGPPPDAPSDLTFAQRLARKPAEIRQWWIDLNAVFATDFLLLIAAIYFLQGMGGFPDFVMKYVCMCLAGSFQSIGIRPGHQTRSSDQTYYFAMLRHYVLST